MSILEKLFSKKDNKEKKVAMLQEPKIEISDKVTNSKLSDTDKIKEIELRMAEMSEEYNNLRINLKKTLFMKRDSLSNRINDIKNKITNLEEKKANLQYESEELSKQNDNNLVEELAKQKQQLSNQNELVEKYKEQNNGVESQLSESNDKVSQLNNSIFNNKKAENDLSEEIKTETDLKKMYSLMENQKKAVANLYEDREKIVNELNKETKKNNELTSENNQLLSSIKSSDQKSSDIRQKINDLDAKIKTNIQLRQQKNIQLDRELSNVNKDLELNKTDLGTAINNLESLDEKIRKTFDSKYLIRDINLNSNNTYAVLQPKNDENGEISLKISKFISNSINKEAIILSTTDSNNFSKNDNIFSLYSDLQKSTNPSSKKVSLSNRKEWKQIKEKDITKIYDQDDKLLMIVHFDSNEITSIDYFKNNKITKTNIYNSQGILSIMISYDDNQNIEGKTYYRIDGSIVLSKSFENESLTSILLYDDSGLQTDQFSSELELINWWLSKISKENPNIILIGDPNDHIFKDISIKMDNLEDRIAYLEKTQNSVKSIKEILERKPLIENILVSNQIDLQTIQDITERDINVSLIKNPSYSPNSQKLPKSLV